MTYLAILNILLPLQVLTGVMIWGAERWPQMAEDIGGLSFVAPLHALVAWLFAAFLIMHIYLTTTGHTTLANMKAMVTGWEDVAADGEDVHEDSETKGSHHESGVERQEPSQA